MGVYLQETTDRNGAVVKAEFLPSADMLRFAMSRASIKNDHKSDKTILKELGIAPANIDRWYRDNHPYFADWLVKVLENFRAPVREALFAFGVDQAFRGNFNYWKEVSKTVGAISPDKVEVINVDKKVTDLSKLSPEELKKEEERLLAELTGRSTEESGVASPPEGGEQGSDSPGDSSLPQGPEILAPALLPDRGCSGPGEPTQALPE